MSRLAELTARRQELIRRSADERLQLTGEVRAIAATLQIADRISMLLGRLMHRPVLAALGAGAVLLLGPQRVIGYAMRTFAVWATARRLLRL